MGKFIKSKKFLTFIIICVSIFVILIAVNFTQFKKYQINKRNEDRKRDLKTIADGIKKYVKENNNLPTTSDPEANSFLPELILLDTTKPTGGVTVDSLENVQNYFDIHLKDQNGNPYFIGTYDNDQVLIYTNNYENLNSNKEVYFESVIVKSENEGKISPE